MGVLFNGLLAELPTILDTIFTSTTSNYIVAIGQGLGSLEMVRKAHIMQLLSYYGSTSA